MSQQFYSSQKQTGMTTPDLFVSTAKEKRIVQCLQAEVKEIIESCYPDTDALIAIIEDMGLPVITAKSSDFQLKLSIMVVGSHPGFIAPTLHKYETFIDALKKHMPTKAHLDFSKGVIIAFENKNLFTFLTYHFYHWMAYQQGLPGYEEKARKFYNTFNIKYNGRLHPDFLEKLDYDETSMLRMAIRRDKEALQFVKHLLDAVFIPLNNGKLLDKGQAQA